MTDAALFLIVPPGLEPVAAAEARAAGFDVQAEVPGGIELAGGWPELMRAHLVLRMPVRILLRLGSFHAPHLAMLDKRARRFPWADWFTPGTAVRVDATVKASKIWHAGAAAQRIQDAAAAALGPVGPDAEPVTLKARIVDDLVTLSLDASGEPLHKRGHKPRTGKAPLRETLAAAFLAQAGFDGTQAVIDPMCGSGTLVLEAAEIAAGLHPGRSRSFAFERLAGFDRAAWDAMRAAPAPRAPAPRFWGYDRDDGAIRAAQGNAQQAGVQDWVRFNRQPITDLAPPPDTPPGLVITNPPWGARIGERKLLFALYGSFGRVLGQGFRGWRVAVIAPDAGLVGAMGLGLEPAGPPVDIGGIKARLWCGTVG